MREYCHTFMEAYSKQRNKPSTQRGYQGVIDRNIIPIMERIFRQLEPLEAEGRENYVILLAIRAQFEFAARRSEICPLEWDWVDMEKRKMVWPDRWT